MPVLPSRRFLSCTSVHVAHFQFDVAVLILQILAAAHPIGARTRAPLTPGGADVGIGVYLCLCTIVCPDLPFSFLRKLVDAALRPHTLLSTRTLATWATLETFLT